MFFSTGQQRALLAIFATIAFGIVVSFRSGPEPFEETGEFRADVWKAHRAFQDDELTRQAGWLIDRGTLKGRSRNDVVELLGDPDHQDESGSYRYLLGPNRLRGVMPLVPLADRVQLVVKFDDAKRVSGTNMEYLRPR
jgi:hypothetical protein